MEHKHHITVSSIVGVRVAILLIVRRSQLLLWSWLSFGGKEEFLERWREELPVPCLSSLSKRVHGMDGADFDDEEPSFDLVVLSTAFLAGGAISPISASRSSCPRTPRIPTSTA